MPNQPSEPKPNPIQRLQQWLAHLRGSDVIVANIGQGASDVVVGKNILKIGTLVIPALPLVLALITTLLVSAAGTWLLVVPADMPQGTFNVAVAEFSQIDSQGRERVTADSALISRTLFTTIQGELQQLPADYPAVVWHDSMGPLEKRVTIGAVSGADTQARTASACKQAQQIGAAMIVYGVLDASQSPALLRLAFCVRDVSRNRDMGSLAELQSVDRLGGPLPVDLPLGDIQSSVNPVLRVRTALLAKLVVGLRYELSSSPNFQASLTRALAVFKEARLYLEREDGAATGENGGDLVAYFIGRESYLLFQEPSTPADKRAAYLEEARRALSQATDLNPQYARAWSALGSVYYQRIQQLPRAERLTSDDFTKAFAAYQAALRSAQASQDRPAEAEAWLSLAITSWLQGDAALYTIPADPAAAQAAFTSADRQIAAAAVLIQPEHNRLRGFAAMLNGLLAHDRAQIALQARNTAIARALFQQAQQSYIKCIAAGQADPGDQFLQRQIIAVTCEPYAKSVALSIQQLPSP